MDIVVLDGGTTNPDDLSWAPLEALGRVTVYDSTPADCVVKRARDAEALIVNRIVLNRAVLDALPKLRYIGTLATGYNTIDVRAAREKGVTVCNVPLYCVETVAQLTFALLLALCCRVEHLSAVTRSGGWNDAVEATHTTAPILELSGKTRRHPRLTATSAAPSRERRGARHARPRAQPHAARAAYRLHLVQLRNAV